MKFKKEIITGISTVVAVLLLVAGVNFLKGSSFFGGDDYYYAYFPNSGRVAPAASVYVNGVEIGRVLEVEFLPMSRDSLKMVKMKFIISEDDFKIPKGSRLEAGSIDPFNTGLTLHMGNVEEGYYKIGESLQGETSVDLISQVKQYADPIKSNLEVMMSSVDRMVKGISAFWDTTATSELESSMREVRVAIKKFGNAADQIEDLVVTEKVKLSRIFSNVQQITENLKKSNDVVKGIVGNVKTITDDLVTADFKSVIGDARETLQSVNKMLDSANNGEGTLGKLVNDPKLYNELVETNNSLQSLLNDLQLHPERYIHVSVFGSKTKTPFTADEEKKLRKFANDSL